MTSSKGLPFQHLRSFHYKAIHLLRLEYCLLCAQTFTLWKLTTSWGISLFTTLWASISYTNLYNLPPAVFVFTPQFQTWNLIFLFSWRQPLEYLKTEDTASLVLFCPPSLHVFRSTSPSWSFFWILSFYLGLNSTLQDNFNKRVKRPGPIL